MKKLEDYIINIPDFPQEGIIFRDITGVLQNAEGLKLAIDGILDSLKGIDFDLVVAPESRGFVFGVPIAYELEKAFIPVRKKGKLPRKTVSVSYDLEYGTETIELHEDSIKKGDRVVIIDDLMATGGTVKAMTELIEGLGGEVVKLCFVIELEGLKGRDKLQGYNMDSLIKYEGK